LASLELLDDVDYCLGIYRFRQKSRTIFDCHLN
jgi:hypothetical protein